MLCGNDYSLDMTSSAAALYLLLSGITKVKSAVTMTLADVVASEK